MFSTVFINPVRNKLQIRLKEETKDRFTLNNDKTMSCTTLLCPTYQVLNL